MTTELKTIRADEPSTETAHPNWKSLYRVSGAAASIAGVLFLLAILSIAIEGLMPGTTSSLLTLFQNNWLVVIFKLHAGFNGIESNLLYELKLLDIVIMAFVATTYLGLYVALRRTSKIWSAIAAVQPIVGIVLFIATETVGRSAVMGAGLVISAVMLRSNIFNKVTAFMGLLSSILLLVGDISVGIAPSNIIAILTGIGYVLLMTWFFLIARRLFQLGRDVA